MKIVEITEKKMTELSEGLEDMLAIGGKLMSCIEELKEESEEEDFGMRRGRRMSRRMGRRGGGYGYRRHDDMGEDDPMYY